MSTIVLIRPSVDNYQEKYYELATQFIYNIANLSYTTLEGFNKKFETLDVKEDFKTIVLKVVYRQDDLFSNCTWIGDEEACMKMFYPALTEVGFCYSFNSLHSDRMSPWNDTYVAERSPRMIYETDAKWMISLNFMNMQKYKIYIHSADILPGADISPQHVWDSTISTVLFSSKETYTTEDARQLSIRQRKCIFEDEMKLPNQKIYSYWACMSSCRMKRAMDACSCVPHFYEPIKGFQTCSIEGLVCLSDIADELAVRITCPCELGCRNTVYEVEKLSEAPDQSHRIKIGFESWPMIKYKREVLFGWVDLLVSFGGIAGLFLGFSLLSAVELIYYFTLRMGCMALRKSEREELYALKEERSTKKDEKPKNIVNVLPMDNDLHILSASDLGMRVKMQMNRHRNKHQTDTNGLYSLPYLD